MGVKFNSNGKLLLSGEYLVLKGAKSLSIPTRFSQTLEVSNNASGKIKWESYDQNKKIWFCLLYTSPSPRDRTRSRMPSSA